MKLLIMDVPIDHLIDRMEDIEWSRAEDGMLVLTATVRGQRMRKQYPADGIVAWQDTGHAGELLLDFLETENGTRDCTE